MDENLDFYNKENYLASEENLVRVTGMYKDWFLDYASYVILERAIPDIFDGLKPVQRRILHSMKELDDGRFNKVANIVGNTMQFHPHGDASISDAIVQIGQKDLLIETQGNWGNILTGDRAAASRYIEARLTKFALEVVFSPKITDWQLSYDGRKKEPIHLPVKFPLLLEQGFSLIATKGTANAIQKLGHDAQIINKVTEGRPHIVDELVNNKINLLINTTEGRQSIEDSASIRRTALQNKLFCVTTIFGAFALLEAMSTDSEHWIYNSLQEIN